MSMFSYNPISVMSGDPARKREERIKANKKLNNVTHLNSTMSWTKGIIDGLNKRKEILLKQREIENEFNREALAALHSYNERISKTSHMFNEVIFDYALSNMQNSANTLSRILKYKTSKMNDNKTITIEAPEGFEVDKGKSTDTVIKFKKSESKRPMSWMELKDISGYYIHSDSEILPVDANTPTHYKNRNIWPTKGLSEASLALSQLLQLRDAWNGMTQDDFVFDGTHRYFSICNRHEKVFCQEIENMRKPLSFKDEETRDAFLKQFRPLIETALPLL